MEMNNMNMTQLRALAKENNLRGYSRLRKADQMGLIRESLNENEPSINEPIDEPKEQTQNKLSEALSLASLGRSPFARPPIVKAPLGPCGGLSKTSA